MIFFLYKIITNHFISLLCIPNLPPRGYVMLISKFISEGTLEVPFLPSLYPLIDRIYRDKEVLLSPETNILFH